MSRLYELLDEAGEFFLATVDDMQPKLRPIGAHIEMDGKVIFGIGAHKDVYRQLVKNPYCEIAGMVGKGKWFRLTGKAVFEEDASYAEEYLETHAGLRKIYNQETGHKLAMFHLEDAAACLYVMGRIIENIPL